MKEKSGFSINFVEVIPMNSGNPDSKEIIKEKTENCIMTDRIGFIDSGNRKEFFLAVRKASGAKSWRELALLLGLRRNRFQEHQYGQMLLPEKIFNSMLTLLPKEKQESFATLICKKPSNWGMIKGGENNYTKNSGVIIKRLREGFKRRLRDKENPLKFCGRPTHVDLDIPLSKELCELVGAIIGDGCIDGHIDKKGKSKYHVQIVGNSILDKDYLLITLPVIAKNIFGINASHYFRKDRKALNLNFYSKWLFTLLTKRFGFPSGKKTYTVKIPEEIMNSEEKFVFATIRGIFDTDGCVFADKRKIYKKPYGRIVLKTVSQPLYTQVKEFLENYFSLYSALKKTEHAPIYEITIYGNKQIEKWMQLIGFSNQRHLSKIEKLFKPLVGFEPTTTGLQNRDTTVMLQRPNLTT